jgi:putative phosphoesterase
VKIGIISDTHDDVGNLETALAILRAEGVTRLLHCGDVCGPDVIRAMAGFDVWIAQGNMDRSLGLAQAVQETRGNSRMTWLQRFTLDGYAIAMIHGDNEEVLGNLITSGKYKYILHGHTHRRRDQKIGRTRVINPGALGGTRHQARSFCILDLTAGEVRFVEIP